MNEKLKFRIIALLIIPLFVVTIIFTSIDSTAKSSTEPKVSNIEIEYPEYSFDKVVKNADAIAKLEILNKVSETKKKPYRTLFQAKVIDSFKMSRSLQKGMVIKFYQDGNSSITVNRMPIFKNKEKLLLFLKKDAKTSNTYSIVYGPSSTYKLLQSRSKTYAIKQDKFDGLLAASSLFQSGNLIKMDSKFVNTLFEEAFNSKRQIDIFNEEDLIKLIKEYVEEASNPFIVNYNIKNIDSKLMDSSSEFGLKIFKKEANDQQGKNVILSPLSIFTALNVVLSGAGGQTEQQMKSVMGLTDYSKDALNKEMNNLINYTNASKASGMPGSTKIFNSIWINNSFSMNEKFEKDTQKYYNSNTFRVDFSSPATIADMNSWINTKTCGLIPKAISSLEKNTSLSIFNVLYFNGKWSTPFAKANTVKEDFLLSAPLTPTSAAASNSASAPSPASTSMTSSISAPATTSTSKALSLSSSSSSVRSSEKIKVDMMNAERMMSYYEDEKVKAGIFDYYNGNMMIIVPQGNFDDFISDFGIADIENYNKNHKYLKAKIKVPKFKVETKNSLKTTIKDLGMMLPFDPANADFSGISSANRDKEQKLAISQILHDCVVKVDEEGTEAAALTSVMLSGAGIPPETTKEFYVDKPFIFVIQGTGNLMLFIGKVENPLN